MKNYLLIIIFLFFGVQTSIAQKKTEAVKPFKNHFGIGFDYRLSSSVNIPGLKFEYYLNESWSLNLAYYASVRNHKVVNIVEFGDITDFRSKYAMHLGLGVEKHFFPKLRIDPFIGLNAYYTLETVEEFIRTENYKYNSGNSEFRKSVSQLPSSHGYRTTVNLGLSYFILPVINIGFQGNLGYAYSSSKMETVNTQENIDYDSNGNITNTFNSEVRNNIDSRFHTFTYNVSIKTAFYFSSVKK